MSYPLIHPPSDRPNTLPPTYDSLDLSPPLQSGSDFDYPLELGTDSDGPPSLELATDSAESLTPPSSPRPLELTVNNFPASPSPQGQTILPTELNLRVRFLVWLPSLQFLMQEQIRKWWTDKWMPWPKRPANSANNWQLRYITHSYLFHI